MIKLIYQKRDFFEFKTIKMIFSWPVVSNSLLGILIGIIPIIYWRKSILRYLNQSKSFLVKYVIDQYIERSMKKMKSEMKSEMNKQMDVDAASFTIYTTRQAASITYWRNGTQYMISVPYNRSTLAKDAQTKVILDLNGTKLNITQQPGIPYLVTPGMIGGDYAVVHYNGNHRKIEKNELIS